MLLGAEEAKQEVGNVVGTEDSKRVEGYREAKVYRNDREMSTKKCKINFSIVQRI